MNNKTEITKAKAITLIAGRIEDEFRKHGSGAIDWQAVAASKIYSQWFEHFESELSRLKEKEIRGDRKIVELEHDKAVLKSELSQQKEEIEFLKKVRIDQNDAICKLESELSQQKELVEEKESIIEGLKSSISGLEMNVRYWKDEHDRSHGKWIEQDGAIFTLKQEIEALKKERDSISEINRKFIDDVILKATIDKDARIKELEDWMEMYREENYLSVKFKSDLLNKLSDENLATEILARYLGNSRGNPISKRAFIDCALWIKKFVEAYSFLSTPTTEPKEGKYTCKKCKREIDDTHEGYCPHCGNVE